MCPTSSQVVVLPLRALSFEDGFADFLQNRQNQQVSDATLATYELRFGMFRSWCEEQGIASITEVAVNPEILKSYFNHLRTRSKDWTITMKDKTQRKIPNDKKLSRWTVKSHFLSLHALFRYLVEWERIPADPTAKFHAREFRIPRSRMHEKFCPSVEQIQQVLALFNPAAPRQPYHGVGEEEWPFLRWRNHTLLLVMSSTALRAKEVLGITMDDLDLDSGVLRVLRKGQHRDDDPRIITFTPSVRQRLRLYATERAEWLRRLRLKKEGFEGSEHLFISGEGKAMSKTALRRLFDTIRKATAVPVTPHLLRHFAITEAWKVPNASPRDVQTFADHTDIRTTLGYSHYSLQEARAFAERADFATKLLRR